MLNKTNAVVSLQRNGAAIAQLQHIAAFVKRPGPANLNAEGLIVSTTLLLDPLPSGVTIKSGDQVVLETFGGHAWVGQTNKRTVLSAPPAPVDAELDDLAVQPLFVEAIQQ